jgi:hypothetical protein
MNDVSKHNGSASDTARPNERNSYDNLSEAEFLAHEAELAKTALSNTLGEIKADLARAGNIKLWAHHYPWLTAGLAVATGFTLAAVASGGSNSGSSNNGSAEGSLAADEEAQRQRLVRETAKAPYNSLPGNKPKLGDSLLGSLFSLARTALEASLVSAIREQGIQAQSQPPPATAPPPATVSGAQFSSSDTVDSAGRSR